VASPDRVVGTRREELVRAQRRGPVEEIDPDAEQDARQRSMQRLMHPQRQARGEARGKGVGPQGYATQRDVGGTALDRDEEGAMETVIEAHAGGRGGVVVAPWHEEVLPGVG
jgi:hypothetical protein